MIRAWHFVGETLRDGRPVPPDGEWLVHPGKPFLCEQGLHASIDPFDALQYAPGGTLCLVELRGIVKHGDDKVVASERRIIARMDFTEPLRYFARMEALLCVDLWSPPDVVLDYLMTGDESIRAAAWDAAWSAGSAGSAGSAAWSAAEAAARAAARAEARERFNQLVAECFEGVAS